MLLAAGSRHYICCCQAFILQPEAPTPKHASVCLFAVPEVSLGADIVCLQLHVLQPLQMMSRRSHGQHGPRPWGQRSACCCQATVPH